MDASAGRNEDSRQLAHEPGAARTGIARVFALKEWAELLALRNSYHLDNDRFNARELEHLCFIRWLHQTDRLAVERSAHDGWTYR